MQISPPSWEEALTSFKRPTTHLVVLKPPNLPFSQILRTNSWLFQPKREDIRLTDVCVCRVTAHWSSFVFWAFKKRFLQKSATYRYINCTSVCHSTKWMLVAIKTECIGDTFLTSLTLRWSLNRLCRTQGTSSGQKNWPNYANWQPTVWAITATNAIHFGIRMLFEKWRETLKEFQNLNVLKRLAKEYVSKTTR